MKTCTYCGRENEDSSLHCRECGTDEFKAQVTRAEEQNRASLFYPGDWLIIAAGLMAGAFAFALLGLLLNVIRFDIGGGEAAERRRHNANVFFAAVALVSGGSLICGSLFFNARSRFRHGPSHNSAA